MTDNHVGRSEPDRPDGEPLIQPADYPVPTSQSEIRSYWPFISFVRGNIGAISAATPLVLAFFRIGRVSSLEPSTLALLVQTVDIFRLVLSTAIQWGPPLILLAVGMTVATLARFQVEPTKGDREPVPRGTSGTIVTVLLLCIIATSPQLLGFVAIIVFFGWGMDKLWNRWDRRRGRKIVTFADNGSIFFGYVLLFLLAPATMWLPAERLDVQGKDSVVGYVLKEEEGRIAVMIDESRAIVVLDSKDVTSRRYCRISDAASRPLIAYLGSPPAKLEKC